MKFLTSDHNRSSDLKHCADCDLVGWAVQSDKEVFYSELYDRYANKVYRKCVQMIKDINFAQDLTHDILVKAFDQLPRFQGKCKFSTWLFQITYSHCIDFLRKAQRRKVEAYEESNLYPMIESDSSSWVVQDGGQGTADTRLRVLHDVLQALPLNEKALILQKYIDRCSIAELAAVYNTSPSAIKMRLKRSRDKIKKACLELLQNEDRVYVPENPQSRVSEGVAIHYRCMRKRTRSKLLVVDNQRVRISLSPARSQSVLPCGGFVSVLRMPVLCRLEIGQIPYSKREMQQYSILQPVLNLSVLVKCRVMRYCAKLKKENPH